jgi:beta-lactamase superfamily II metal-dependent hydrolase
MRAAWMASVFLAAFLFQRKPHLMNALAIVIIAALLLQSNLLFLAGVQLSYGVVAAISIGLALSQNFIKNLSYHDSYLPRELYTRKQEFIGTSWEKLLQSLSISLAACLGSAPLTIKHFGMITPISIVANLFLSPLVFALLGLAMLSTFLSVLSPTASSWCNRLNSQVARGCIGTSAFFAAIPGSHQNLSWHRIKNDAIHIHDLPRGGGAALVQTRDSDILLDTGNERSFRNIVLPSLRYLGCEPDTIFLSHPESHHIGGATMASDHLRLRQIISPVSQSRAASFRSLYAKTVFAKLPFYQAREGVEIRQSDEVRWTILHVPDPQDRYAIADDRVAVYLLTFHGYRILFLNDAGPSAWDALREKYASLRCDVIVCGRHQLHPLMAEEMLDLCNPRVIISTNADFPVEEKIPSSWPKQLQQRKIVLFDQGTTGMMRMEYATSGQLLFRSFLSHHDFALDQASTRD